MFSVFFNETSVKGLKMHVQANKGQSFPITIAGAADDNTATKLSPVEIPVLTGFDPSVLGVSAVSDNGDGTFSATVTLLGEPGTTTSIIASIGAINGKLDVTVKPTPVPVTTKLVITAGAPAEVVA